MIRGALPAERETNLIRSFSQTQLSRIKYRVIRESSFLELAVCAFFSGAESLLSKQGGVESRLGRAQLANLISRICNLSERNAIGLIDSVERLSGKYAIVENIIDQGATAADRWLNCEETVGRGLIDIVEQYKNLTMFDLGIEGVNEVHEASQRALYDEVDVSVGQLRRRELLMLFGIVCICVAASLSIYYFWLQ